MAEGSVKDEAVISGVSSSISGRRLRRGGSSKHLTVPLEDHAVLNSQAWGVDVSLKYSRLLDLDSIASPDFSADFTTDQHGPRLNLSLDPRTLTNNQGVWGIDLTPENSADPDSTKEAELSLELATRFDDSGDGRVKESRSQIGGFSHIFGFCMAERILSSCSAPS